MNYDYKDIISVIDIGTSKIVVVVAAILSNGKFEIIAIDQQPSYGVKKGLIVDIKTATINILTAINKAELISKIKIKKVYTSITGNHINWCFSNGEVIVKSKKISALDIRNVINIAKDIDIISGRKLLHVIVQNFIVDGQNEIMNPLGMIGDKLEVKANIITGSAGSVNNIINCINNCKLELNDIFLQSLASSSAVLSENEKKTGVLSLDIGGGTTDISIFYNGNLCYTKVIPIAGNQITNDIATLFKIPTNIAEIIKIDNNCDKYLSLNEFNNSTNNRQIKIEYLNAIIDSRIEELFSLIKNTLIEEDYYNLISYVVITGGTSKLSRINDFAEKIFSKPVRLGWPNYDGKLSNIVCDPSFSTAIGLVKNASDQYIQEKIFIKNQYFNKFKFLFNKIKTLFMNT